jgi:hypothetical protein
MVNFFTCIILLSISYPNLFFSLSVVTLSFASERVKEIGHLEVPAVPIARGLTPPDVAVHRGWSRKTRR